MIDKIPQNNEKIDEITKNDTLFGQKDSMSDMSSFCKYKSTNTSASDWYDQSMINSHSEFSKTAYEDAIRQEAFINTTEVSEETLLNNTEDFMSVNISEDFQISKSIVCLSLIHI